MSVLKLIIYLCIYSFLSLYTLTLTQDMANKHKTAQIHNQWVYDVKMRLRDCSKQLIYSYEQHPNKMMTFKESLYSRMLKGRHAYLLIHKLWKYCMSDGDESASQLVMQ